MRPRQSTFVAAWATFVNIVRCDDPKYGPWHEYKTEPTFNAAILNISRPQGSEGLVSANAHLVTTLRTFHGDGPWGPQIFDPSGELVFYSHFNSTGLAIQDPHICTYGGETVSTHLCSSHILKQFPGHLETVPMVYDSGYEQVHSYEGAGFHGAADGHEFNMLPSGKEFLSTLYCKKQWDLSALPGGESIEDPWVFDACFREVDIESMQILYHWCFLDRLSIVETVQDLTSDKFKKHPISEDYPFDFAHINSVDKDKDGNFLVSMKYLGQILKIAGPDNDLGIPTGTTIWRLGGKSNQFQYASFDVGFEFQHHIRSHPSMDQAPANTEMISLFDNHCADHTLDDCKIPSSGKIILLDHNEGSAQLVRQFRHPDGKASWAGGSVKALDNGNVFVSWGQVAEVSEFSVSTGELLMHTRIGASSEPFQYRSDLAVWKGFPIWKPKVIAYLQGCDGVDESSNPRNNKRPALHLYLSWNGATEAKIWQISGSITGAEDSFEEIGEYAKTGFETHVSIPCDADLDWGDEERSACSVPYIVATAVDKDGHWLPHSRSEPRLTYIPPRDLLEKGICNSVGCRQGFLYDESQSAWSSCAATKPSRHTQNDQREDGMHVSTATLSLILFTAAIVALFIKTGINLVGLPPRLVKLKWLESQHMAQHGWTRVMADDEDHGVDDAEKGEKAVEIVEQATPPRNSQTSEVYWSPGHRPRPSFQGESTVEFLE